MPTTSTYTTLPGTISGPLSQRRSGQSRFYLPDHQGNTRLLTDVAASPTDTMTTDAWGVERASTGLTVNPFKAFGKWGYFRDSGARHYIRARSYAPEMARWLSPDPVVQLSFRNRYPYVENRPVREFDPTGLQILKPCDPPLRPDFPSYCTETERECYGITKEYGDACRKNPNGLDCCASCVSRAICEFIGICDIIHCCTGGIVYPRSLCDGLQCQNSCMLERWRRHDTPLWKDAERMCKRYGTRSFECCSAKVIAEQDGYTRCTATCGLTGALLYLIPESWRLRFAVDSLQCCGRPMR